VKLFIDSNIIIEALKQDGNKEAKDIWKILLNHLLYPKINLYVNAIVYSESVYKLVIKGKKKSSLIDDYVFKIFKVLSWLDIPYEVKEIADKYVKHYKLSTNDSLILASCQYYKINYLLSIDNDFSKPCEKEGIPLINSSQQLSKLLKIN
jgi:hypothetical protein